VSAQNDWTDSQWLNPPSIFRSAPFWAWNDRLNADRLCRQIEQMHAAGMGGFFMHSRYGLKTPYLSKEWFECVSACVEKARGLEMKAYLYDEDRWPSGSCGGMVTRDRPDAGLHRLVVLRGEALPEGAENMGAFAVRTDAAGRVVASRPLEEPETLGPDESALSFGVLAAEASPWFNDAPYLDTLNREAVRDFIRLTHQAYADRFGEDFGGLIPAIFTDEPNYAHAGAGRGEVLAALPWTAALPREFRKRRGYDLRDHLVGLVCSLDEEAADGFSKVRYDYYRTVTELFVESFSAQIGAWCGRHRIALTGHYLAEETLTSQIRVIGAAMPHYEHQQWPGIDILTDQRREIATVKQCSSVADQLGRERVLSELYGCTGWDWQLEGHKFNGGWQYVLGVNFRCPHLSLYSLAGGAKRDYPASIFPHSPWWKYYRTVEDYFARLSLMLTRGSAIRDVLVVHPIESAWGTFLPGGAEPLAELDRQFAELLVTLLDGHYDYDLGDESLLARHARVNKDRLKVGKMTYRLVVVPPSVTLRSTTVALLEKFVSGGGRVVFVGRRPQRVDGEISDRPGALAERAACCGPAREEVIAAVEGLLPRRVSVTEGGRRAEAVWTMLRKVKGGQLLFLQSCDRTVGHDVRVCVRGRRPVVLWDAETGRKRRLEATVNGDRVEFDLHLPQTGSALVSLGLRAADAEPVARPRSPPSSRRPVPGRSKCSSRTRSPWTTAASAWARRHFPSRCPFCWPRRGCAPASTCRRGATGVSSRGTSPPPAGPTGQCEAGRR